MQHGQEFAGAYTSNHLFPIDLKHENLGANASNTGNVEGRVMGDDLRVRASRACGDGCVLSAPQQD